MFCTECAGTWGPEKPADRGVLGCLELPPAGLRGRSTESAVRTAWVWENLNILAIASGICWHCSARVDKWVDVCEDHDAGENCDQCDRRYPLQFHFDCTNCIYDGAGTFSVALATDTDLLVLLADHDLNPVSATRIGELLDVHNDYDETVRSTDPFEATFTFTVDGDALTLTVDEDLEVVDATRQEASSSFD